MTFSIITCTYNPNTAIFNRLIKAVSRLEIPDKVCIEWIIVDNNSKQSVEQTFDFTSIQIPLLHVVEQTPGLTSARIAGFKASKGDWLVFFDDDNEPASNFIFSLRNGHLKYPHVNCWGPGFINVEYIGKVKPWFQNHKEFYQYRNEETCFGHAERMQAYYPIGTGLCIKREAFENYVEKVETGQYNVSDRTGRSLVSGGDTQIVLNNQLNGGISGKLKELSLTHMIEARKANFRYLSKQKFWTAASYHLVLNQVYLNKTNIANQTHNFGGKDTLLLIKKFYHQLKVKKHDIKTTYLNSCGYLGEYYAPYIALNKTPPFLLKLLSKLII